MKKIVLSIIALGAMINTHAQCEVNCKSIFKIDFAGPVQISCFEDSTTAQEFRKTAKFIIDRELKLTVCTDSTRHTLVLVPGENSCEEKYIHKFEYLSYKVLEP